MKRASFIQSVSLLFAGAFTAVPSLPFENGPNHIIIDNDIRTIDKVLSDNIKNKKHLKMFQHMLPAWIRSNKINITHSPHMNIHNFDNPVHVRMSYELILTAFSIIAASRDNDAHLKVARLLEDYTVYVCHENGVKRQLYENNLLVIYNSLKSIQIV